MAPAAGSTWRRLAARSWCRRRGRRRARRRRWPHAATTTATVGCGRKQGSARRTPFTCGRQQRARQLQTQLQGVPAVSPGGRGVRAGKHKVAAAARARRGRSHQAHQRGLISFFFCDLAREHPSTACCSERARWAAGGAVVRRPCHAQLLVCSSTSSARTASHCDGGRPAIGAPGTASSMGDAQRSPARTTHVVRAALSAR